MKGKGPQWKRSGRVRCSLKSSTMGGRLGMCRYQWLGLQVWCQCFTHSQWKMETSLQLILSSHRHRSMLRGSFLKLWLKTLLQVYSCIVNNILLNKMTNLWEVASLGQTKNILIWIIWGGYFTTSCPLILLLQIVGNVHWTEKTETNIKFSNKVVFILSSGKR